MQYWIALFVGLMVYSCQTDSANTSAESTASEQETEEVVTDSAAWVIQKAIAYQGGDALDTSMVTFLFRDRLYATSRQGHRFLYRRTYSNDEKEMIEDRLTNSGFERKINGEPVALSARDSSRFSNSVNSVNYFAFLPYFLTDPAVNATYHGTTNILGGPHYKIGITFAQEGGGKDFEDEYAYWFRVDNFNLDYLAYNYLTDGGGARFREAYNPREVLGIRFQDYVNYKPLDDQRNVLGFDTLFQAVQMDTLSIIELEQVTVNRPK